MQNQFKIKIHSQNHLTYIKADKDIFECGDYRNYLRDNKYYIFYLLHSCYTDHINNIKFNNDNIMDMLIETNFQKIVFNSGHSLIDLFNMWYETEIKLLSDNR